MGSGVRQEGAVYTTLMVDGRESHEFSRNSVKIS
jgi:hypothetical protein